MNSGKVQVTSLGGGGEEARSCFLTQWDGGAILLDCGVRREAGAPLERVYPALTSEIAKGLQAVFLSHAHEDHTAALPYLRALGYRGPVYATGPTAVLVPGFLRKWASYSQGHGDRLPFGERDLAEVRVTPLPLGTQQVPGLPGLTVTFGRSGHMLGSVWMRFAWKGTGALLYTGDMALEGRLLAADPLPQGEFLILECAYVGSCLAQDALYRRLLELAVETVAGNGRVLLPVPPRGRGADLLFFLAEELPRNVPLWAEGEVVDAALDLLSQEEWLRMRVVPPGPRWTTLRGAADRGVALAAARPGVYLTPDGMLSSPAALEYLDGVKDDPKNLIVITGHAARGTAGAGVLCPAYRSEKGIRARAERVTIKVHLDEGEALGLARETGAAQVLLFHAPADRCGRLEFALREKGIRPVPPGCPANF